MAKQNYFFCLFMTFLVITPAAFAVVDKWTPAGFNWSSLETGSPDTWKGLYQNLSHPSVAVSKEVMAMGVTHTVEDGTTALIIPFTMGAAWQVCKVAIAGASVVSSIRSCIQNEGNPTNIFYCAVGLAGTIISFSDYFSAAKKLIPAGTAQKAKAALAVAANAWSSAGLEAIALSPVRRDLGEGNATAQKMHNYFVYEALTKISVGDVEFVGYAPDNHRLGRRSMESAEHPYAPMFKFEHKKYGKMEITSRDAGAKGLRTTISYAGHPTHHASKEKRDEYYQHERLDTGIMEGRFDGEASNADPATISFDAEDGFDQIESALECAMGDSWQDSSVISVQMYDNANQATFAFGSIGIFADHSADSGLEDFEPTGMPLPQPSC